MQITVVMDSASYRISVDNKEAIRKIPKEHRQRMIDVLEVVKAEHRQAEASIERVAQRAVAPVNHAAATDFMENKPERLGEGDIADLMSRLVAEENRNKKQGLTQKTIYKWAGGILIAIVVLTWVF